MITKLTIHSVQTTASLGRDGEGALFSVVVGVAGGGVHERAEEGVHSVDEVAGAQRARLRRVRLQRPHRLPRRQLRLQVRRQRLPHGPRRQDRPKHTKKEARVWQVGGVQVEWPEAGGKAMVQGGAAVRRHLPTAAPPVVIVRVRERRRPRHAVQDRRRVLPRREAAGVPDRRRRHRARRGGGEEEGDGEWGCAGRRRAHPGGGA